MRLAITLVCVPALAIAAPPQLVSVKAPDEPIVFSAPVGWQIHIEPVQEKSNSVVASMSRHASPDDCGDSGGEIAITIAIDQVKATPAELLESVLPDAKPKMMQGWLCVVDADDVTCAGKISGLDHLVTVHAGLVGEPPFKRMNPPELVIRVAKSLSWHGKLDQLHEWQRDGTKAACK